MKKQLLGLLAVVGLLVVGGMARADQYVSDFHITNDSNPTLFGDFHVVINLVGQNVSFNISPTGGNITDANLARFTFFDVPVGGTKQPITSGAASTDNPYSVLINAGSIEFDKTATSASFSLQPLNGTVTLGAGATVKMIRLTLSDGGSQTKDLLAAPEASSLAMLLPGLIPLGMVLRRRRANRS